MELLNAIYTIANILGIDEFWVIQRACDNVNVKFTETLYLEFQETGDLPTEVKEELSRALLLLKNEKT